MFNKRRFLGVLGSSPVQQSIAQPREVRKEATVSKKFCVTQGSLTSLFLKEFKVLQPPPMARPLVLDGKTVKSIWFIII